MKFINLTFRLSLKTSLFLFCIIPNLFGFGEYQDEKGHKISFIAAEKKSAGKAEDFQEQKKIFIDSFADNYSVLKPEQIKPHFKSPEDVKDWLGNVFDEEMADFRKSTHPMHWINITKNGSVIGFALFEEWKGTPQTWHLRQLAILPSEQRHHYGKSLVWSINYLKKDISMIIADTRKLNPKGRPFFKTLGFKEFDKPHDPELSPQENYIGLEWIRSKIQD